MNDVPVVSAGGREKPGGKPRRAERIQIETDRQRIVGEVILQPDGYKGRLSDAFNRPEITFTPVVNATVSPLEGGESVRLQFLLVCRDHVRVAFPLD